MGCYWEKIEGFESYIEYKRFLDWINRQIELHIIEEIPAHARFMSFNPRWFRCLETGEIWTLIPPDGPFRGYWGEPDDEGDDVVILRAPC